MRITVLLGGPSDEREISLVSGKAVADALREAGHEVTESDVGPENLAALDIPADVIFPVLHGRFGEDGELQEILEKRKLPFVGSGSAASRIAIDKGATKDVWRKAGLPTADWVVLTRAQFESGQSAGRLHAPAVVKPVASGSSIDVAICQTDGQVRRQCEKALTKYPAVLVERFIKGAELTVGIVQEAALPPIRITTSHEFYTKQAKYEGGTEYHFDLNLPEEVVERCKDYALRAHQSLGCRDLSRVDMMIDGAMQPYLLEINTMPGFTARSLLPKAAAEAGIPFAQLVDRLAKAAAERHAATCC